MSIRRKMAALAVMTAAAMAGCASFTPLAPEQQVQQRADQYWKARIDGDMAKAYGLVAPAYRNLRTLAQFSNKFGAGTAIQTVEVVKVNCEAEKCTARLKILSQPMIPGVKLGTIATYMDEVWVLEDGQWWHHHDL